MNRKEIKSFLPILQAFADGKEIECREEDEWYRVLEICNEMNPQDYRIKPEPKYRPFKNAEECWTEMLKHQPFGWITFRCAFFHIIYIEDKLIGYGSACGTILHSKFNDAFKDNTFADGTPFGVKVE